MQGMSAIKVIQARQCYTICDRACRVLQVNGILR